MGCGVGLNITQFDKRGIKGCLLWCNIWNSAHIIKEHLVYHIGKVSSFSCYFDPWCRGKSLYELFGNACFSCLGMTEDSSVNSLLDNGSQRLPSGCLGCICCTSIKAIIPSKDLDDICWVGLQYGYTKNIKAFIFQNFTDYPMAKSIWFKSFSINHALYCCMASMERLKTFDKLK